MLPAKQQIKIESLQRVLQLLQTMFIKGVILSENALKAHFERFAASYSKSLAESGHTNTLESPFGSTYMS